MQEYVTRAVVLDKATRNDVDARYSFFTERYGKIAARAKSSRKIVSKLAGHLEPGTLAAVRIIEQHGAQVVDALTSARVAVPIADLAALNNLLPEWQPDAELWQELALQKFSWPRILAILGWDPHGAVCTQCNLANRPARHFYLPRQEFFCAQCARAFAPGLRASRFASNQLLLIDE
jgi:recombinational DNA repair protein (RecF pathway)